MPVSVRVAVVGGGLLRSNFDRCGNDVPYVDRPAVDIEVDPIDTLRHALQAAAQSLDVRIEDGRDPVDAVHWVAFYDEGDESALSRSRYVHARDLTLVDDDGRVTWRNSFDVATIAQVIRAADAGVIAGDPRRPYLILQQPGGGDGGFLLIWQELLEGWTILMSMLTTVSTIEGGLQFRDRIAQRVAGGAQALADASPDIEQRRGQPLDIAGLITRDAVWHPEDLAKMLGCSHALAMDILRLFGYSESGSGLWRSDNAADAAFVREYLREITYAAAAEEADFEMLLKARTRHLLETGQRADAESLNQSWVYLRRRDEAGTAAWWAAVAERPSVAPAVVRELMHSASVHCKQLDADQALAWARAHPAWRSESPALYVEGPDR